MVVFYRCYFDSYDCLHGQGNKQDSPTRMWILEDFAEEESGITW